MTMPRWCAGTGREGFRGPASCACVKLADTGVVAAATQWDFLNLKLLKAKLITPQDVL
jgi:hypothetical protein